jgi:hypothetical protein
VCIGLLEKYSAEKKSLLAEHENMKQRLESQNQGKRDVDEFIRRLKKYAGAEVLTRQMCLDLIECSRPFLQYRLSAYVHSPKKYFTY